MSTTAHPLNIATLRNAGSVMSFSPRPALADEQPTDRVLKQQIDDEHGSG